MTSFLNDDPFSRKTIFKRDQNDTSSFLGEATTIEDNSEEENKRIAELVPKSADVEEGYKKMMSIMGYDEYGNRKPSPNAIKNTENKIEVVKKPIVDSVLKDIELPPPTTNVKNSTVDNYSNTKEETNVNNDTTTLNNNNTDKPNYKDEEVLPLLDSMLTRGYASETFNLRNDIPLTIRCQFLWEDRMVFEYTDNNLRDYTMRTTGTFFYDMYSLASNLERIGGVYFKPLREGKPDELKKSFEERVKFLNTLPSPLISIIALKRIEFLKKLNFVIENNERLLKVF